MRSLRKLFLVGAVGALLIVGGLALNTGSVKAASEDDIRDTVLAAVDARNAGDAAAFLKLWTDQGLMDEFGFASREEAEQVLPEFIGEPPIEFISIDDVRVFSGNASAEVQLAFGGFLERFRQDFLFLDQRWQFHTSKDLSPVPPAGTKVVGMKLVEYAFVYDKAQMAQGNVALGVRNAGVEEHEVALVRLNTSKSLDEVLQTAEPDAPPEGIELVGVFAPIVPGQQIDIVLTEPLSAGRYAFVCFFPAPDGTPHAFLGMRSEFTVDGGISPPSTGDAGLAQGSELKWLVASGGLGLGALVGLSALGLRARSRRTA